ncbi:permease [Rudanella paleaurantiibacter]|uniref:Permease n=1 Tax=Rudanella paleaurantiibacter TaxID=2614655 RepID=A0A7J5TYM7_9BACT|nr:LEA type 2 family protein [Rudanella paleaurantiibacter]KAB7730047.1 permease [Rudanella paleaurantiibacter]
MKKGWIVALLLLFVGAIGAYVWYSRLKHEAQTEGGAYDDTLKPRLEMSTIEITNMDDDVITMNVKMLIDNPLPVGFKANKLRYTVYIAKTPIIEESYAKTVEIEPGDSTFITLPMKLQNKKMMAVLNALEQKDVDSTTYGVRAAFDLDVPVLGERTFTQTFEKRLPTVYVPKIKIEDLDFGKMGLKRTDVAAKVSIENRNSFPIQFTDTHYRVSIDGKEIAEGHQPEPVLIKKQATTSVVFPVTMKPGNTLSLLPKMLFNKKDTPFLVTMQSKLIAEGGNKMLNESRMNTVVRGTLADLKKD